MRKYLRLSLAAERLPALLGREFFRTQVTSYNVCTFENVVIFVHDVECRLVRLECLDQESSQCCASNCCQAGRIDEHFVTAWSQDEYIFVAIVTFAPTRVRKPECSARRAYLFAKPQHERRKERKGSKT